MTDYDKRAIPDVTGEDFWYAEKTMWYHDYVLYGKPLLEVYSLTVVGGNQVTGVAPTEIRSKRAEYPCSITSPSEEEIRLGIMLETDRRVVFYIDEDSEEFPDNVEQVRVNNIAYEIVRMQNEQESGRCEIVGRPLSVQGRMGIS